MNFGSYLREIRERQELRQSDLAKMINVSTVYVCDIEKGRRYPPNMEKLKVWVEQLDLPIEEATILYDLAGVARESTPPDIMEYLNVNPAAINAIRRIMKREDTYNWDIVS